MAKRILVLVAVLLLVFQAVCLAEPEETQATTGYTAYMEDAAGLLDVTGLAQVHEAMQEVTGYAHAGFLTYSGSDTSGVLTKARRWGDQVFGEQEPYAVLMIDMATRRLGIYSSRSVYRLLNTAKANTITDNVYTYASQGLYADCAVEAFRQMAQVMRGEQIAEPMKKISNAFLALILAILMSYLLISARMKKEQAVVMPAVL